MDGERPAREIISAWAGAARTIQRTRPARVVSRPPSSDPMTIPAPAIIPIRPYCAAVPCSASRTKNTSTTFVASPTTM